MVNLIDWINKIYKWFIDFFAGYADKIIISLLIFFIGFILARILERLFRKVLRELELNSIVKMTAGIKVDIEKFISRTAAFVVYFITIIAVLNNLGLTTTALNIVLFAFLLLVIVSFILAVKDFIPNFFAGFMIHKKKILSNGDSVKIDGIEGIVKEIGMLQTKIVSKGKDVIFIPNSAAVKSMIKIKKKVKI